MEDIRGSSRTTHGYKVDKSKIYCQSEVKYLLQQLSSWREESNRQFSNIIDSQTSNINKGINDLADEVGDLDQTCCHYTGKKQFGQKCQKVER